jgi:hypothetical protein
MVGAVNTHAEQAPNVPALRRVAPIFPVRDLNLSLAFYERLGFGTDTYDEGYGFARRERLRLHLRIVPELNPLANNSGVYVDAPAVDALHSEWLGCGSASYPPTSRRRTSGRAGSQRPSKQSRGAFASSRLWTLTTISFASARRRTGSQVQPRWLCVWVRIESGYMEPTDLKSNRSARLPGGRMSLDEAAVSLSG